MRRDTRELLRTAVGRPLGELAGLALPTRCGGCGEPGVAWCLSCDRELGALDAGPLLVPGGTGDVMPDRCVPVVAGVVYDGVVRPTLHAMKEQGRRDLVSVLAPFLSAALVDAVRCVAGGEPVIVVPAPSSPRSYRERGEIPAHLLTRAALSGVRHLTGEDLVWAPILEHGRRVVDQAGLGRRARAGNIHGAFRLRRRVPPLEGAAVVVADDVFTTGATVRECVRVLRDAGAGRVAVATMAVAPSPRHVSNETET